VRVDRRAGQTSVEQMHIRRIDVDVREEVRPHEPVVRVRTLRFHREILVQVEGRDASEGEPFLAMQTYEFAIDADRGGAGGEAEDRDPPLSVPRADHRGDAMGDLARELRMVGEDPGGDAFGHRSGRCDEARAPRWGHGPRRSGRVRVRRQRAHPRSAYAEKLLPQPQPPVAFGFLKVKPEPCIEVT